MYLIANFTISMFGSEFAMQRMYETLKSRMAKNNQSLEDAYLSLRKELQQASNAEKELFEPALEIAQEKIAQALSEITILKPAVVGTRNHIEWYSGPSEDSHNWHSYCNYLRQKGWEETIKSIDQASTKIVSRLACPTVEGNGYRLQGLVLGYVQSGKTASMMATIAKAADEGYRIFIILAGMTDSLRIQTQNRIESDLTCHRSQNWEWITRVDQDFSSGRNQLRAPEGGNLIMVVKKNGSILRRILKAIKGTSEIVRQNQPVLIIDDECDQASVNSAKNNEDSPTRINALIRDILNNFPRCCYLGYTATPFANLLINPDFDEEIGRDLYPHEFIISLPRPDNYFGVEKLFGADPESADDENEGQNMIRNIPDDETVYLRPPNRAQKDSFIPTITQTLEEALLYFLMVTAARHFRGQKEQHSSMLIHTSVYRSQHFLMQQEVDRWLQIVRSKITNNNTALVDKMERIWDFEINQVSSENFRLTPVAFSELQPYLPNVLKQVTTAVENSDAEETDRLDYGIPGQNYIVIGGNVLARGLTIEGLSVSYFLRTSTQYDTLMQMGRWFGYRRGYEDLPRIWMTEEMATAFRNLATVEVAIRDDIEEMWQQGLTPAEFAVRIPRIPQLQITSRNRMRNAEECSISYRGEHLQTFRFDIDQETLDHHWLISSELINYALDSADIFTNGKNRIFKGVSHKAILDFLRSYRFHKQQRDLHNSIPFIQDEIEAGQEDMKSWNIVVLGNTRKEAEDSQKKLGNLGHVTTIVRSRLKSVPIVDIKALLSKADITADLGDIQSEFKDWLSSRPQEVDCWASRKRFRAMYLAKQGLRSCPSLIICPIEALSRPYGHRQSQNRIPLDAPMDVIGLGIVFPGLPLSQPKRYVRVRLTSDLDEVNEELEDFSLEG
ncbi:Z1 domain-containing protein [Synechococcus elongatus]|uniref:Z1 domain-containing protein n=1 Tax=Synechococcus elongatus TaxID=32046 RepID=UPI0030D1250D